MRLAAILTVVFALLAAPPSGLTEQPQYIVKKDLAAWRLKYFQEVLTLLDKKYPSAIDELIRFGEVFRPPVGTKVLVESSSIVWIRVREADGSKSFYTFKDAVGPIKPVVTPSISVYSAAQAQQKAAYAKPIKRRSSTAHVDSYYTKEDCFAAHSEADLSKALQIIEDNDKEAMLKLINAGRVLILKPGVKVRLETVRIFSGIVEVRPQGNIDTVWTIRGNLFRRH